MKQKKRIYTRDEIELIDLLNFLSKKKYFLIFGILFSVILSFFYMFFHDPIYEARVILTPSIINDLSTLNYSSS